MTSNKKAIEMISDTNNYKTIWWRLWTEIVSQFDSSQAIERVFLCGQLLMDKKRFFARWINYYLIKIFSFGLLNLLAITDAVCNVKQFQQYHLDFV